MAEFALRDRRVWVAGHGGMVGSAIVRRLGSEGCEIITAPRAELDLFRQSDVADWLATTRPDAVFLAAAVVGGIHANSTRPAEFIQGNLSIELNVIDAARKAGVRKLMLLGSSCIYPKLAPQPMTEDSLLTGPLEETNEWYAIAKIAGIKLCQAFRRQYGCDFVSVMPTNLYGPGDNFDLNQSHVVPALMRRMHDAGRRGDKSVEVWGSGKPMREFLHVDDMADACVFLMQHYSAEQHVNIGTGSDVSIRTLAEKIKAITAYSGSIQFDPSKPDGTPRKLLDVARLHAMGWRHRIDLDRGLDETYRWFVDNYDHARLNVAAQ